MTAQSPAPVQFDEFEGGAYPPDLYHDDVIASGVDGLAAITDEHIAFFREYGYLAVHNAFSQAEVAATLAGLLDLIDGKNPDFKGVWFEAAVRDRLAAMTPEEKQDVVRKLQDFVRFDARLQAMAEHPDLLAAVRRILGDQPVMMQDMALLKPPGVGREKPWHQDKAFFTLKIDSPVLGVWIALDAATLENGCMHVISGSHREGPVVHFRRRDFQICDTSVQTTRDVAVPLAPGGCLFFDGLIHHGTPANRTNLRRRAVQYHYTTKAAVWTDEVERFAVFGSEGKGITC